VWQQRCDLLNLVSPTRAYVITGELFTALYSTSISKLEVCDYNSSRACALPRYAEREEGRGEGMTEERERGREGEGEREIEG
jgi:hypothetical protein